MKPSINKKIGLRLATIRKMFKVSQSQLAEVIDRSPEFISRLERGVSAPSLKTLYSISVALGVPLRDFFDFDGIDNSWETEIEAVTVRYKNRKGHSVERNYRLSRIQKDNVSRLLDGM